jgi:hypothetical protein
MAQWQLENLLCSRLLHDISAPLNAMGMSIEMLHDEPSKEQVHFLQQSYAMCRFRLEFLRLFLGASKNEKYPEFTALLDYLKKCHDLSKYTIEIHPYISLMRGNAARLFAGLFLIGITLLPRGGCISIEKNGTVHLKGSLHMVENIFDLPSDVYDLDSKTIIPFLTQNILLKKLGARWDIHQSSQEHLTIRLIESSLLDVC